MDKTKFYMAIPQFFSRTVVSWMCGAPKGQNIQGAQVPDYSLLCISDFCGNEEASMWISGFQNNVPKAEIRVGEIPQNTQGMDDLDYLLTFPFSTFVLSFSLDEAAADVKQRLAAVSGSLNTQLTAKIEALIDGAIADYQNSK